MELAKLFARIILKDDASGALAQIEQGVQRVQDKMKAAGDKVSEFGGKMAGAGTKMTAAVTAPILGIGAVAINAAVQFENAQVKIQNSLGVTKVEAEKLSKSAKEVWKDGFGESVEEVTDALLQVRQNMKGLNEEDLQKVTKSAMNLGKTFDADVNEVARAGQNIMTNFGISADEAFDMMAHGAQNGLNFSNEMFDNLAEYAPLWAKMGYSAEEMFGVLQSGAEQGVYNLDYLNDVMKEFQIRATDGSKSTLDAVAELGPTAQKVWKEFSNGKASVKDMADAVTPQLAKIKDETKRNELGVALFGTKWEDLTGDVVLSMLESGKAISGFGGKMDEMNENAENSFGQKWASFTRTAQEALIPLGETLLDVASKYLPPVIEKVTALAEWFRDLSPTIQKVILVIGGIAAALGPVLMIVGTIIGAIGPLIPMIAKITSLVPLLAKGFAVLSGPVGWAVLGIAALTVGTVALVKHMSKASIESDIFGDKVSEGTKKAVGAYMDLDREATAALNNLAWGQKTITSEMASDLIGKYKEMGDTILTEMQKDHKEQLAETQKLFSSSSALTDEEEAKAIAKLQDNQAKEQQAVKDGNAKIAEIINKAKDEKRAITEQEQIEINKIQEGMKFTAVKVMSETQAEQKAILESMSHQSKIINAETAAETAKIAIDQKNKVVAEAEDEYNKKIAEIIRMRDESGAISTDQANKLIEEATRQKDEIVAQATETHDKVIEKAKLQAEEHVNQVDWETGEIKSKWQIFKEDSWRILTEMEEGMNQSILNMWNGIKEEYEKAVYDLGVKLTNFKDNSINKFNEMKDGISEKIENIKGFFVDLGNSVATSAYNKFIETKNNILNPIKEAKETISGWVDDIKGLFSNLKLTIPSVKLPKLPSISSTIEKVSGFSLPKIKWNAKGGIFDEPTIFNTKKGLQGVGEAGPEAIMPLSTMKNWFAEMVDAKLENQGNFDITNAKSIVESLKTTKKAEQREPEINIIFQGDWTVDSDERQQEVSGIFGEQLRQILRSRGDKV